MQPVFVIFIILYLLIFFSARKKAKQKEEEQKNRSQNDPRYASSNRPQSSANYRSSSGYQSTNASYSRSTQTASRPQSQSYNIDSSHYHKEGYDFATCFSFKDVPKGADELSALIAANSRHERELQKLLHTRE